VQNRINRIQLQQQSQFELSDWLDDIWCCHGLYLFPSPGERAPNNSKCTQDECVYISQRVSDGIKNRLLNVSNLIYMHESIWSFSTGTVNLSRVAVFFLWKLQSTLL